MNSSSTTDELSDHNNTNRHAWFLFFQMPQRLPSGKGNGQHEGWEGERCEGWTKKTNRTGRLWMTSEKIVSLSTWNVAGGSWVYFCQPKRLPGALSKRWLLCCVTRKEKKKHGAGRRVGVAWELPPSRVCFPPGKRDFQKQGCDERWTGGNFGLCRCLYVCMCFCGNIAESLSISYHLWKHSFYRFKCMIIFMWSISKVSVITGFLFYTRF